MSLSHGPGRASHNSGFGGPPPSVSPFSPTSHAPPSQVSFIAPPPAPVAPSALTLPASRAEPPPLSATLGPMPGTLERPIRGPKKRIIMTCDGTWVNETSPVLNGQLTPPSNVSRIGWAIKDTSRDGIPQVVNYQAGVGTSGGRFSRLVGGAFGTGIRGHIREAYTYVATNYRDGDEIFLIGFSRGAFTARSVGGMIGEFGLLTRKGLPSLPEIFEDYENKSNERYQSKYPDVPFPDKGPFNDHYVRRLVHDDLTRPNIPIKAICVWDTVGNLGIPISPLMSSFGSAGRQMLKQYQFDDTRISPCVENAFQALALDEQRAPFAPALWEKEPSNNRTNLKQVWFPGVHSNVGGGYDDQELANITLAWMMSRLEPFLDFRPDFLIAQFQAVRAYYKDNNLRPRPWSMGEIYRSLTGAYTLLGPRTRTPGNYYRIDPYTGRPTTKRLRNTNEYIHASARSRLGLKGPGLQDRGEYNPPALANWTFEPESIGGAPGTPGQGGNLGNGGMVVWNYRGDKDSGGQHVIPEAVLLETELALLRQFREIDEYIKHMREPVRDRRDPSRRHSRRHSSMPPGPGPGGVQPYMNGGLAPNSRPGSRGNSVAPVAAAGATAYAANAAMNHKRRSMGFAEGEIGPDGHPLDLDDDDDDDDGLAAGGRAGANEGRRRHRKSRHGAARHHSQGPDENRGSSRKRADDADDDMYIGRHGRDRRERERKRQSARY